MSENFSLYMGVCVAYAKRILEIRGGMGYAGYQIAAQCVG